MMMRIRHRRDILKSGQMCDLLMDVDDSTFREHFRLNHSQFTTLLCILRRLQTPSIPWGGRERIPFHRAVLMTLWYLANENSFRELSDKFCVARGSALKIIRRVLQLLVCFASSCIKWWVDAEKASSSEAFYEITNIDNVIGAIDGCHIRITRPAVYGDNYLNRKGYYSIILQGVCDDQGRFRDVYVGPPGRVHDARVLKLSPVFNNAEQLLGNNYKLLGDSAYIANVFPFILTPKRDNGLLTQQDIARNSCISRGRVIIENTFGRLKCRFRRLRDVQNTNLSTVISIVIASCALHNFAADAMDCVCTNHPSGCPRPDDDND